MRLVSRTTTFFHACVSSIGYTAVRTQAPGNLISRLCFFLSLFMRPVVTMAAFFSPSNAMAEHQLHRIRCLWNWCAQSPDHWVRLLCVFLEGRLYHTYHSTSVVSGAELDDAFWPDSVAACRFGFYEPYWLVDVGERLSALLSQLL